MICYSYIKLTTNMGVNTHHKHLHSKKRKKRSSIDQFVYVAVIAGPLLTLPQLYTIWYEQKTDVSLISWAAYLVIAVIWLFYGIKHKEKPIIVVQLIWIILDAFIVIGLMKA